MNNVLITGATGNVGLEVIKSLSASPYKVNIVSGLRDPEKDILKLDSLFFEVVRFDFEDPVTFLPALEHCDILFLLRPPQITDMDCFVHLINAAKKSGIKHIVFLSVQGVEKSSIIPHHKIEKLIRDSKVPYTFLRPAYFMQNFTTTLHKDLVEKHLIYLPAGNAEFTLIDVRDIGAVAAEVICHHENHINKAYELTCNEKLTFNEMAIQMTAVLGVPIKYTSPNLFAFYITKRKEKVPTGLILVMIMLHYLPRFQKEPKTSNWIKVITGREPITFRKFLEDNRAKIIK